MISYEYSQDLQQQGASTTSTIAAVRKLNDDGVGTG